MLKHKPKNKKVKVIVAIVIASALVGAGAFAFQTWRNRDKTVTVDGINYGPASETEKNETDAHKKDLEKRIDMEANNNSSGNTPVTPVIVDASQYLDVVEVSAYVPGVIQDGGTCTVKLVKGGATVTKTVNGIKDATTTRCPVITIPKAEFSSTGTWTATVSYNSSTHSGTSKSQEVSIK